MQNRRNRHDSSMGKVLYTVHRPTSFETEFEKIEQKHKKKTSFSQKIKGFFAELKKKLSRGNKRANKHEQGSPSTVPAAQPTAEPTPSFDFKPDTDNKKSEKKAGNFSSFIRKNSLALGISLSGIVIAGCFVCLAAFGVFSPRSVTVTINDSGRILCTDTTEQTVGDMLEKNGITLGESDVIETSLSSPIEKDMEIVIRRAATINIIDAADSYEVKMLAGTVGEAIDKSGLEIGETDEIYPSVDTYIYSGMTINIIRVTVETVTKQEPIPFKEITRKTDKYEKGKTVIAQEGQDGLAEEVYEIVYKNGEEYSRTLVSETVIYEAVDKIIYQGTYVNSKTGYLNPKDENGNLIKAPTIEQIHSGTLSEHKAVAPPSENLIWKTVIAYNITAYHETSGQKTATGILPRIGTVAANPKQIPYGTKIYVPGYGYGRIEDTGSNKHSLDQIFLDLYMNSEAECNRWGRKKNVKVYLLK